MMKVKNVEENRSLESDIKEAVMRMERAADVDTLMQDLFDRGEMLDLFDYGTKMISLALIGVTHDEAIAKVFTNAMYNWANEIFTDVKNHDANETVEE